MRDSCADIWAANELTIRLSPTHVLKAFPMPCHAMAIVRLLGCCERVDGQALRCGAGGWYNDAGCGGEVVVGWDGISRGLAAACSLGQARPSQGIRVSASQSRLSCGVGLGFGLIINITFDLSCTGSSRPPARTETCPLTNRRAPSSAPLASSQSPPSQPPPPPPRSPPCFGWCRKYPSPWSIKGVWFNTAWAAHSASSRRHRHCRSWRWRRWRWRRLREGEGDGIAAAVE